MVVRRGLGFRYVGSETRVLLHSLLWRVGAEVGPKISMVSSGVWAGEIPIERAHALKEVGGGGRTMKQELERIGYLGEMEASYKAMPIAVSCQ